MKNAKNKFNLYEEVTQQIIDLLSDHLQEWNKPWISIGSDGQPAHNATSGRRYSGINQFLLSIRAGKSNFPTNAWITFAQARQRGGKVKKGQKSSMVVYWKTTYFDRDGKRMDEEYASTLSREEMELAGITTRGMLRYFNVFNVAQTDGLEDSFYEVPELPSLSEWEKDERAENLIMESGAQIEHVAGNKACYNRITDVITLPLRKQFTGTEAFYATALHELGHWTGHHSRLNRDLGNRFGTPEYALEELVAELTATFLSAELGFSKNITRNAAYIQSWITALENDTKYIFRASWMAQEAVGFIGNDGA